MSKNKKEFKNFETVIKYTKTFCWIVVVIVFIEFLLMLVPGILNSLEINNSSLNDLVNHENVIEYISDLNSINYSGAIEIISRYDDKVELIIFEIVGPLFFSFIPFILLIGFFVNIFNWLKDVKDKTTLFTNEKLTRLRELNNLFETTLLFFWICYFDYNGLILILDIILGFAYLTIIYLFKYCVEFQNK